MSPTTALMIIAHGSRSADANADAHHLAGELARRGFPIAVAAFLELAEPDIDGAAAICVDRGATHVIMLPHFLSAGTHVQRDLTAAADRLAKRFFGVEFRLAEPLGRHPMLVDILAQRARQAAEDLPANTVERFIT